MGCGVTAPFILFIIGMILLGFAIVGFAGYALMHRGHFRWAFKDPKDADEDGKSKADKKNED